MRRALAVMAMATTAAWAQAPARRQAATAPSTPSYTDLKYPPLRAVTLPRIDAFTLPNGMRLLLQEEPRPAPGHSDGDDPDRQPL